MRHARIALLALAAGATTVSGPVAAQEWQVARESFTFVDTRLTIYVDAEAPGSLQVVRGAPGTVRVASRAATGFTTSALDSRGRLTLTAAGDGPVDYLVSVPDQVWVDLRLPGQPFGQAMGGQVRSRSFDWDTAGPRTRRTARPWLPPLHEDESLYTTFGAPVAPGVVRLPELANVRSVTVRIQGDGFRVTTSRPLAVAEGSSRQLEIRPAPPAMDIVLFVPSSTRSFRLEAGPQTALSLHDGQLDALCSPVTRQWLSRERQWVTFNPVDGALQCADSASPRHEG